MSRQYRCKSAIHYEYRNHILLQHSEILGDAFQIATTSSGENHRIGSGAGVTVKVKRATSMPRSMPSGRGVRCYESRGRSGYAAALRF